MSRTEYVAEITSSAAYLQLFNSQHSHHSLGNSDILQQWYITVYAKLNLKIIMGTSL